MRKITHLIIYSLLLVMAGCEKDTEPANFAPRLTTGEVSGIFRTGATLSGSIEKSEGVVVKEYGILYSTLQSMAEYEKIVAEADNNGKFSAQLTELEAGKTYYYCAYASSGYSIAKGEVMSFLTVASEVPVFSTLRIEGVDEKSFVVNTSILDEGGSEIAIKGFCWKEVADNSTEEPKMSDESKNLNAFDEYQWRVSDLKPGRKYAVRAYAVNGNGLGYGTTTYVNTKTTNLPVVSSCVPNDSTSTSIQMLARILANASSVTEKGFCYSSTKELPEVTDMRSISNVPDTVIFATISDLVPGNTYYIRAYATGSQGTGYGDVFSYSIPNGGGSDPGIYSAEDLMEFRDACNAGGDLSKWMDASNIVNINADIDLSGKGDWVMIDKLNAEITLEGNGHTIRNLTKMSFPEEYESWALIQQNYGCIRNLNVEATVRLLDSNNQVRKIGTLNYACSGSIISCRVSCDIEATGSCVIGGITTYLTGGMISDCRIDGKIVANDLGGICYSQAGGQISQCTNYLQIEGGRVGGIVDFINNDGKVSNCVNYGTINQTYSDAGCAGIVGYLYRGTIEACRNEGKVTAGHFNSPVGGILGDGSYVEYGDSEDGALRAVINCVNTGDITGTIAGNICGALGLNSTMSGCTFGGTVNGVPGVEANAIGRDGRASSTNKPDTGDIVSPDKQ